jgi:transposase
LCTFFEEVVLLAPSVGLDIFVVHTPVSFSKGFDGLSLYCEAVLGRNPLSGAHFVFRNRSSAMIRVLFFDGHRTWCVTGRNVKGKIPWWPKGEGPVSELAARELSILLHGGPSPVPPILHAWRK